MERTVWRKAGREGDLVSPRLNLASLVLWCCSIGYTWGPASVGPLEFNHLSCN